MDVGCGDGVILGALKLDASISYTGIDVVQRIIEVNRKTFPSYTFEKKDPLFEPIPKVDLILCKDVLQHLPNKYINAVVKKIRSHCKYALFTNDILDHRGIAHFVNRNIPYGQYRCIDLQLAPFHQKGEEVLRYQSANGEWKSVFMILGD